MVRGRWLMGWLLALVKRLRLAGRRRALLWQRRRALLRRWALFWWLRRALFLRGWRLRGTSDESHMK
jgi:hypothetical protein